MLTCFRGLLLAPVLLPALALSSWSSSHWRTQTQSELVQVQEDFCQDPGWEAVNNRIVCTNCPSVNQDFGWSPTSFLSSSRGEIGGIIWRSTTPAYYGLPIGRPLSWEDRFWASGRLLIKRVTGGGLDGRGGAAYLGFFNSRRQGWRPWSSVAVRLIGETEQEVSVHIDYMTAQWGGYGDELQQRLRVGVPHTWTLSYDPEAVMPAWTDTQLRSYLSQRRQTDVEIFEKARQIEPGITLEAIRRRLREALAGGYIRFFYRRPHGFWTLNEDYGPYKGGITLQFDGGQAHKFWVLPEHRRQPLALDRFGIFNLQMYHSPIELYVADLKIRGQTVDLSRDPHWDGKGNRVRFVERDFQRQDFGFSFSNWAGKAPGEAGGQFYRTEAVDPMHGYYADRTGALTLDDPLSFSASVAFLDGSTDAGMFIGYFNAREKMAPFTDKYAAQFLNSSLGLTIEGPTRAGYYLNIQCTPTRQLNRVRRGPVFVPTGEQRKIRFTYDPGANGGVGRIEASLDQDSFTLDLTPEMRRASAVFDRFGLMNVRRGGKYVRIYFDDMTYTVRAQSRAERIRHEQRVIALPYPPGGRRF